MSSEVKAIITFIQRESGGMISASDYFSSIDLINVSNYEKLTTSSVDNENAFLLDYSKLDGQGNLYDNKEFDGVLIAPSTFPEFYFEISLFIVDRFVMLFNKNYGYPTRFRITYEDGAGQKVEYTNDSYEVIIEPLLTNDHISIKILEWSNNDGIIGIDAFYVSYGETFYNKQLSNLTMGNEIENSDSPSFSVIGKYGNFDLIDIDDKIKKYAKKGLVNDKCLVQIVYNNSVIGKFYTKEWKLSETGYKYSITLSDKTYKWSNIYVKKLAWQRNWSALDLLDYLLSYADIYEYAISTKTRTILERINLDFVYTEYNDNLLGLLNKFCELTLTNIIFNSDDVLEVVYIG